MRRLAVIALALSLALLPVLHSHSLLSLENTAPTCPVCTTVAGCAVTAPSISAPLAVTYIFVASVEKGVVVAVARTFSPRGPPLSGEAGS
jgi:hypothetical protein